MDQNDGVAPGKLDPRAGRRALAQGPAGTAALALSAALIYLLYYWLDRRRPLSASLDQGWWTFSDQGRYLRSTLAWAAGNLDPAEHWYLPGYPLLGVPFVRLTPANPFLIPDLLCLVVSLFLTAAIARRLAPAWPWARLAGAVAFLATSILPPHVLDTWVTPWTTTPETALTLGCALATLEILDRPTWRPALAAALCAAAIAAFRPSDAVNVSAICGSAVLLRLVFRWPGAATVARMAAAAITAAAAILAATVALYWSVNGWQLSAYLQYSAYIGFEWRIIPLQWVQIVLDSRPLLPESNGLVARMPWIASGLAGMAACLVSPNFGGRRSRHALLIAMVAAHMAQYLAYRDLHPQGLWRYYNFHYFKWTFPIFGWYTVLFGATLLQRRRAALAAGAAALALLLPWRASLSVIDPSLPAQSGSTVAIPAGMGVRDALLIPADGTWEQIYHGDHAYYFGDGYQTWFGAVSRLIAYPVPGGIMLAPVFQPPPGPGRATFDKGVGARPGHPLLLARQEITYGIPCFLSTRLWRLPVCTTPRLLP